MVRIIEGINENDILFIDEAHSLPKKACECLYTIMEDFYYYDDSGRYRKTPKFTILAASTEIGLIPGPLRNRFQYIAEFTPYTKDELTEICLFICKKIGLKIDTDLASVIARTCRDTPRLVKNRTLWVHSYATANNIKELNKQQILDIISLQGVDEDGMERLHYEYLKALDMNTVSVDTLSSKIGADPSTIKKELEPWLIKQGLVSISKAGRTLTTEGLVLCNKKKIIQIF